MPSPQHEAIVAMLQARPKLLGEEELSVAKMRESMDASADLSPVPAGLVCEKVSANGVPAEWTEMPGADSDRVVLYLHGGGYVMGSPDTHRGLVARISREAHARCLSVDYRLAPEHPFPAALEDAMAAYRFLLAQGLSPSRLAIAGDSAGGGLTLATLVALRDAGDPLPACGIALSPWADLEGTGASATDPGIDDPLAQASDMQRVGRFYAEGRLRDPLVSPIHAAKAGLPPLLIQVGTREILLDDSRRFAEGARSEGVDVTLEEAPGLIHVYQLFPDEVPESREAVERIGAFVRQPHLARLGHGRSRRFPEEWSPPSEG